MKILKIEDCDLVIATIQKGKSKRHSYDVLCVRTQDEVIPLSTSDSPILLDNENAFVRNEVVENHDFYKVGGTA